MSDASNKFHLIAGILGATARPVSLESPDGYFYITFPDGVQMFCSAGGYGNAGRIEFSGSWPSYKRPEGGSCIVTPREIYENNQKLESPSIKVSESKTPEQIAKDITRRLLPDLRHVWHACKKRCDERTVYQDTRREVIERVAKATGGKARVQNDIASIDYGYDVARAEYRGGYSTDLPYFKVTLEDISPDKLAQIIALVKGKA